MSTRKHRIAALRHFVKIAWPAIEALPASSRMDAFMGLAEACSGKLPKVHTAALKAAAALREVNHSQLLLHSLLK